MMLLTTQALLSNQDSRVVLTQIVIAQMHKHITIPQGVDVDRVTLNKRLMAGMGSGVLQARSSCTLAALCNCHARSNLSECRSDSG